MRNVDYRITSHLWSEMPCVGQFKEVDWYPCSLYNVQNISADEKEANNFSLFTRMPRWAITSKIDKHTWDIKLFAKTLPYLLEFWLGLRFQMRWDTIGMRLHDHSSIRSLYLHQKDEECIEKKKLEAYRQNLLNLYPFWPKLAQKLALRSND